MFWKKKASDVLRPEPSHVKNLDSSRRAVNMFPVSADADHELSVTDKLRFHHLLIHLEGSQQSGCLKIVSSKKKSRSAILIYRGRVVGCLYGNKKLGSQFLAEDAHKFALADLASPGNMLDAYQLPEELVLAAASLFHGEVIEISSAQSAEGMLRDAVKDISDTKLPGCVVVSSPREEMVAMVYVCGGKVMGVFSAKNGWAEPTYNAALNYVRQIGPAAKVMASILPVSNFEDATKIGFSLTGLADVRRRYLMSQATIQPVDAYSIVSNTTYTAGYSGPATHKRPGNFAPARPNIPRFSQNKISSEKNFAIVP